MEKTNEVVNAINTTNEGGNVMANKKYVLEVIDLINGRLTDKFSTEEELVKAFNEQVEDEGAKITSLEDDQDRQPKALNVDGYEMIAYEYEEEDEEVEEMSKDRLIFLLGEALAWAEEVSGQEAHDIVAAIGIKEKEIESLGFSKETNPNLFGINIEEEEE